jgi:hypothetical protein
MIIFACSLSFIDHLRTLMPPFEYLYGVDFYCQGALNTTQSRTRDKLN